MKHSWSMLFLSILVVLLGLFGYAEADLRYCSSLNTGADFESKFDNFQSNGACRETCAGDYAFAIVQGFNCWCSNAAPGNTESTDSCSEKCPGFPDDRCGSTADNLYGYIQLDKASTTVGGPTASESSTTLTTLGSSTVIVVTVTETPSMETTVSPTLTTTTTSSFSPSSSLISSSSRPSSSLRVSPSSRSSASYPGSTPSPARSPSSRSTASPTGSSSVSVHTSNGQVVTVTAPISSPTSADAASKDDGSSISGGAIAGIVIGCVAGVGLLVAAIVWFCIYRRRQNQSKDDDYNSSFFERPVPRPTFQGTLGSREAAMAGASAEKGPNGNGNGNGNGSGNGSHRLSVPAFTDSRLKPDADLYPNGSRHSNVSLQDNQDYSRPVLRLTNPDPPDV